MTESTQPPTPTKTKTTTSKPEGQETEITFAKAHRHGGRDHKAGDKIRVNEREHAKLKAAGAV